MATTTSKYYWRCQLFGWGSLLLTLFLLDRQATGRPFGSIAERTFPIVLSGLLVTHLLRNFIVARNWLTLPLKKGLPRLLLGVLLAGIVAECISRTLLVLSTRMNAHHSPPLSILLIFSGTIDHYIVLVPWAVLYLSWYHIDKSRRESLGRQRLETRISAMQRQAEGSALDLDALIGRLTSIQASIDENPSRCRAEITEFSNLLRKGFLAS